MVDEVVTADPAAMQGDQMPVEAADNGHEIAGVLDGVSVGCSFLLDGIGTVSGRDSFGQDWLLGSGFRSKEE
jgi:hypothetical protein